MRRRLVPDIINLQAFECAARYQNFSRAAEELNLTQSAVSRKIADLERQTGLKLFERVRKRVVLSEAGQRFLPDVKELLLRSERLMIDAVAKGEMEYSLKIATLPTFGTKWLVPRLKDFLSHHPGVAVTVESRSTAFSFTDENFDLAFHFGQPSWAGGVSTFLCHETVVPVAGKELRMAAEADPERFWANARLLHLTTRPELWAQWSHHHNIPLGNPFSGPRFDQFSMITSAATSALGVALLPTYLIESELKSGELATVDELSMLTENNYYIVRPETRQKQFLTDQFETWVLEQVGGQLAT